MIMAPFFILFFIIVQHLKGSDQDPICESSTLEYVIFIKPLNNELLNLVTFLNNMESSNYALEPAEEIGTCKITCDEKDWAEIYQFARDRNMYDSHSVGCSRKLIHPLNRVQTPPNLQTNKITKSKEKLGNMKFRKVVRNMIYKDGNEDSKTRSQYDNNDNDNDNNSSPNKYQNIGRILNTRAAVDNKKNKKITKSEKPRASSPPPSSSSSSNKNAPKKSNAKNNLKNQKTRLFEEKLVKNKKSPTNSNVKNTSPKKLTTPLPKKNNNKKPIKKINRRSASIKLNDIITNSDKTDNTLDDMEKSKIIADRKILNEKLLDNNNNNGSDSFTALADDKNSTFQPRRNSDYYYVYADDSNYPTTENDDDDDDHLEQLAGCLDKIFNWLQNLGNYIKNG